MVIADIMKAFLQIRLADDSDKNRFCFFRKIEGKFIPYRYNTIIFGFVSSPFIIKLYSSVSSSGKFTFGGGFFDKEPFLRG